MKKKIEQPIPQGKYIPATRHADLIYTSGMTPRKSGKLMYVGKIQVSEPLETYREAIRLAAFNALIAAKSCLREGEKISVILQLTVFLNTEPEFKAHSKIADYASDLLLEHLGQDCIGSRTAIGVTSLPSNAPVEIALIGKVT